MSSAENAAHLPVDDMLTVDDEAYTPTYGEAFPPLPNSQESFDVPVHTPSTPVSSWANRKMSVKSSTVTQVFCVPLEERRFKEMSSSEQQFGGDRSRQERICFDIMNKSGVAIEMSLAKDQSLTVVLTGKQDSVMRARKMVVQQLQKEASSSIMIPKIHHRFILGQKGKKLAQLELETSTKINIPRTEENSEEIKIFGNKEGIEKARHEIQLTSDEQAKLAFERLPIPKIYHTFICGPENSFVKELQATTGARINIPPPSVNKDEISVTGEKDGVHSAVQTIQKIYEERKRKCQTVSVEVRKSQHKYVIGPKGCNLNEVLRDYGVSVEVPPLDNPSETITLRGDQVKLGPALTVVYSKANSVVISEVDAPAWLHRFIIGRQGVNVRKVTQEFPNVHIEFTEGQEKIIVEGPPEQVEQAQAQLEEITKDLLARMAFAEIDINQKYHRHIIGKQGSNVTRIKNETGVAIRIPPDTEPNNNIIRIEGSPEGVARAKQELLEMVHKMENEKSRDILLEQRFHRTMIGAAGGKIKEIRDKFNQVQITFPDPKNKSDVVTLRGPKNDVDKCYKYLTQYHQELIATNYQQQVHIFKQFHKNIIGKGGANIKKIRDETDTKIDLPSESSDSDVITITGKKENVEKARDKIENIQKELANIKEVAIDIPNAFHNSIIGAKGRLIRSIMEECGGVIIRFPAEGSTSDKVIVRGPTDDVEKARKQLLELADERKVSGHTAELRAKPEYHKFLIGRGGSNIRDVREKTGARVIFPSSQDTDQELITIIGKKESVEQAKLQIEAKIVDLDNVSETEINVDPKYHRHFVARRGEVLRQIAEEYGGVTVSFPRSGVKSDKVVLKGARDCVDGAKKRIIEIVEDLESQITMECVIPQRYHRTVMGKKGYKVQEITKDFEVGIKFPDPPQAQNQENGEGKKSEGKKPEGQKSEGQEPEGQKPEGQEPEGQTPEGQQTEAKPSEPLVNGGTEENGETESKKVDTILITGKRENCEGAKEALLNLVPITVETMVPFDFHRFVIGLRGRDVRKMMEDFDVNISIPPADDKSDVVKITGPPANTKRAIEAMAEKVKQLEDEKEERALRSFQLEVTVAPSFHPKIIGRRGAVITKIRSDNDVQIQFPEKNSDREDVIIITGFEKNANAAREDILKIVTELEDMVSEEIRLDHRVHSRLIGSRGRAIRKIMDDFKVDIKFPQKDSTDPDLCIITGAEDDVWDCKDHLLNIEEEYVQDLSERESMLQYTKPPSRGSDDGHYGKNTPTGFVVRDAPWSRGAPDTTSSEDFPEFPGAAAAPTPGQPTSPPVAWGPTRKF